MNYMRVIGLIISFLVIVFFVPTTFAQTVVQWNFDGDTTIPNSDPNGGAAATVGEGLSSISFPSGNPSSGDAWSANNWDEGDDTEYFQFCFDATGASGGLVFSFDARRSSTGPDDLSIQYSFDNFASVAGTNDLNGSMDLPSTSFVSGLAAPLTGADNQSNVCVRIYGANASSGAGTLRIDNVTVDAPTAIELEYFTVSGHSNGTVAVDWETSQEVDHAGFNIYRRAADRRTAWSQVNSALIASHGTQAQGAVYQFIDTDVTAGEWEYLLEDVETDGDTVQHSEFIASVTVHVPTAVSFVTKMAQPTIFANGILLGIVFVSGLTVVALLSRQRGRGKNE